MATRQYVGARYVPKVFADEHGDSQWRDNIPYEALTIVTNLGNSYTSRKPVPVGVQIDNAEYWVLTGNYNQQIEEYRQDVLRYKEELKGDISDLSNDIFNLTISLVNPPAPLVACKGDGITDDTNNIQAILDYAQTKHATVVVPSGYTFIFTRIDLKGNTVLKGMGGILKLKDNTFVDSSKSYYVITVTGDNNVVDGIHYEGNSAKNTKYLVGDGITMFSGNNNVVVNCYLHDISDSGIMYSTTNNSFVGFNFIDGYSDCGIYINSNGDETKQNICGFNRIVNGGDGSGIALKRITKRMLVIGNEIDTCANGITLERASTPTDYSTDIMIVSNRVENVRGIGIGLTNSSFCNIVGNRIQKSDSGISLAGDSTYNTVNANVIEGSINSHSSYSSGIILLNDDKGCPVNNSVNSNIIKTNNSIGIWLLDLGGAGSKGSNIIDENVVTPVEYGIRIQGNKFENTRICDNILKPTTTTIGVLISSMSTGAYISGNVGEVVNQSGVQYTRPLTEAV